MAAICTRYQVSETIAYRWRDQFLASGKKGLLDGRTKQGRDPVLEENRRLKELVGCLSLIIDAQKKAYGSLKTGAKSMLGDKLTPVPPGHTLVLRIDRGTQFTARDFKDRAHTLNVTLEYAGIRCPDDNPYIEAFISKYKTEEVYRTEYRNLAEAKADWELYRVWHEHERVLQNPVYRTPHEVYEMHKTNLELKAKMINIYQAPLCPK